MAPTRRPLTLALYLLGAALLILGCKLLVLDQFPVTVPFNDEWDAEGFFLFKPWLEGELNLQLLLQPHNEHRVVLTRLWALGLFACNRVWDPQLGNIANAFLHALGGVVLLAAATRLRWQHGPPMPVLTWLIVALFAIPFSWVTILAPFQSQFYFMLMFAVATLWAFSGRRWWLGFVLTVLAYLSMTSGVLVLPTLACGLGLQMLVRRKLDGDLWIPMAIALLGFLLFWLFARVDVPHHAPLKAQNILDLLQALGMNLSWPYVHPGYGAVLHAPFACYTLLVLLGKRKDDTPLLIYLGLFILLQIAAIAYMRGATMHTDPHFPSVRYWDILLVGLLVNALCLLVLQHGRGWLLKALFCVWVGIVAHGLAEPCRLLAGGLPQKAAEDRATRQNLSTFLQNRDVPLLESRPKHEVGHPVISRLVTIITDKTIQTILPASLVPAHAQKARLTKVKTTLLASRWWLIGIGFALLLIPSLLSPPRVLGETDAPPYPDTPEPG